MLKSIKISLKDTIIYGLGNIAVKVVGLVLIPIFTDKRYFPIDDFGVLGMLEATGSDSDSCTCLRITTEPYKMVLGSGP